MQFVEKIKKSSDYYYGVLPRFSLFFEGYSNKKPINDENFEDLKLI